MTFAKIPALLLFCIGGLSRSRSRAGRPAITRPVPRRHRYRAIQVAGCGIDYRSRNACCELSTFQGSK